MNDAKYSGWRKSSYSGSSGNCVEIAGAGGMVAVRDSKQEGRGPMLEFTAVAWHEFLAQARNGRLGQRAV